MTVSKHRTSLEQVISRLDSQRKLMDSFHRPTPASRAIINYREQIDRASEPLRKILEPVMEHQALIAKTLDPVFKAQKAIQPFQSRITELLRSPEFKSIQEMTHNPTFQRIQEIEARFRNQLEWLERYERKASSLAIQVPNSLDATSLIKEICLPLEEAVKEDANLDAETLEQISSRILEFLRQGFERAKSNIELRAILSITFSILLPFLLFYASTKQLDDVQQDLSERIADSQQEIEGALETKLSEIYTAIESLKAESDKATYYLVKRMTRLNLTQKYSGEILSELFPGQEVELIERDGKWAKVIAIDAVGQQTQSGWVLKKYLKRIE